MKPITAAGAPQSLIRSNWARRLGKGLSAIAVVGSTGVTADTVTAQPCYVCAGTYCKDVSVGNGCIMFDWRHCANNGTYCS